MGHNSFKLILSFFLFLQAHYLKTIYTLTVQVVPEGWPRNAQNSRHTSSVFGGSFCSASHTRAPQARRSLLLLNHSPWGIAAESIHSILQVHPIGPEGLLSKRVVQRGGL